MTARDSVKPGASVTQALLEAWNTRDFDQIDGLTTEDIVWQHAPTGTGSQGQANFRQMMQAWHDAMPDNQVTIRNTLVAGAWEVVEAVGHATHAGPLAGPMGHAPASGRAVDLRFCMVNHLRGGQIDQCTVYLDMSPLLGPHA